jgi:pseudouridine-5'-phosphate glycosidase/pseudouridine kinase
LESISSSDDPSCCINYISPNILELRELTSRVQEANLLETSRWRDTITGFQLEDQFFEGLDNFIASQPFDASHLEENDLIPLSINLLPFVENVIVKCGSKGTLLVSRDATSRLASHPSRYTWEKGGLVVSLYPPSEVVEAGKSVNVTGAGDSFVGVLAAGISLNSTILRDPTRAKHLITTAQRASVLSLGTSRAVSSRVSDLRLDLSS